MSQKNKKQFGIWMDTHHAIIVGRANADATQFSVLANADNAGTDDKTAQHKFYKEILTHMQNAEEIHVTGTGTSQEQFMHFISSTPQFKNTLTHESTSNKMSDEKLVEYIDARFN